MDNMKSCNDVKDVQNIIWDNTVGHVMMYLKGWDGLALWVNAVKRMGKVKPGLKGIRASLLLPLLALSSVLLPGSVFAAETVCAVVKIEIKQELTLERQAFDATMRINNGLDTLPLENVTINVNFEDDTGAPVLATSDTNNLDASFYINVDSMSGIADIAGAGVIQPLTTAEIHWLIIPAPGAGGTVPSGKLYFVGATLDYTLGGEPQTTTVTPDSIYVKPLPLLTLDYFLTKEIFADDALTPEVEPAEPFTLGVRIRNNGAATANNVKIDSAQPKIVKNEQDLAIGFTIIGSHVNETPASNSLLIDFGSIDPNAATIGRWDMLTTLSGKFIDFSADFSHADELGGQLTSILEATNAHYLVRNVLVEEAGRDNVHDFLGYPTSGSGTALTVYESDNVDTAVTDQSIGATFTDLDGGITHRLTMPVTAGFAYVKLPDPYGGTKAIEQVVRSDGKGISLANAWTSKTRNLSTEPASWDYWINFFDSNTTNEYTVVMGIPSLGPVAPVITPMNNLTTYETNPVSFPVSASDANGDTMTLSTGTLPPGASFVDNGNGSGTFSWTPAVGQSGTYTTTFIATDAGGLNSSQPVTIKVNPVNDTDGDGLDDAWEIEHFGDLSRDGTGDFDGDGISDLQEFLDGTDPTGGASTRDWGTPSNAEVSTVGDATSPSIAMHSDGTAVAVWQESDGTVTNIWANQYDPSTGWGTAVLVETDNTGNAHSPLVKVDAAGNAMAMWLQSDGTRDNVWASYYTAASWGIPALVETDDVGDAASIQLVFDANGEAIALWAQADGTLDAQSVAKPNTVWSNRFAAGSWGTAGRIDTGTANVHALGTQLAVDSAGNAMALWSESADDATYNIVTNQYIPATGWNATPNVLRAGAFGNVETPTIVARLAMNGNGDTVVVWNESASPTSVWANTYTTAGGWGVEELIETGLEAAIHPAVAIDANGNALAVFAQSDATRYSVRANRFVAGTGWAGEQLIGTASTALLNGDAAAPQVVMDGSGNASVVWQQSDNVQNNIWVNRFTIADGLWGSAQVVETDNTGDALNPQLAMNSNGAALVTWQQSDGAQFSIASNSYKTGNTGVPNVIPIIYTNTAINIDEQLAVSLDAASSFDQDGSITTYAWSQTGGTLVSLTGGTTATASFTAPTLTAAETLTFQLTITDDATATATETVSVTVNPVNALPAANAGVDQNLNELAAVSLVGSGTDTDGSISSYAWIQVSGVAVTLTNASSSTASFTAPAVQAQDGAQVLVFRLTVTDNENATAIDEVSITINPVNSLPTVNAGVDVITDEQGGVTLNGTASDIDGTVTSVQWTQLSGVPVTIVNANALLANFTAPVVLLSDGAQALSFRITVTDNEGGISTDDMLVTVNPVNAVPVANGGGHRAVNEQTSITLLGSGTDSDGSIATYAWTQLSGTAVTLTGADTATPSFTTPVVLAPVSPDVLVFRLTVTDNEGVTATDDVNIGVMAVNALPTIDLGGDQIVNEQTAVTMAATVNDSDGTIASYNWTQLTGNPITLTGANTATAGFTAPTLKAAEIVSFRLTVTDNEAATTTADIQITMNPVNTLPIADAGASQTVNEGIAVNLNATASNDPDADGSIVSYTWSQISGPSVTLVNSTTATPSFSAPLVYQDESIVLSLTVTDDEGGVATAATTINVVNTNPDDDVDGLDDAWEMSNFGNLDQDGTLDSDGDGFTDAQEYQNGSNPTVADLPPPTVHKGPNPVIDSAYVVTGDTLASLQVDVYVNNVLQTSVTADSNGKYTAGVTLVEGTSALHATVTDGTLSSGNSNTRYVDYIMLLPYKAYLLNPANATADLTVLSYQSGNVITAGSVTKDTGYSGTVKFSAVDLSQGLVFSGSGPLTTGTSLDATDMLVPEAFAGTQFVIPHYRGVHRYYIMSPTGDATVTIDTLSGTTTLTATQGQVVEFAAGNDNTRGGVITSDLPIVVSHAAQSEDPTPIEIDAYPVPPATGELWGVLSQSAVIAATKNNTEVLVYASNGLSESVTLNAGEQHVVTVGTNTANGEGDALHVVASAPVAAVQVEDGDGSDMTAFLGRKHLSWEFFVPMDAEYVAVVCATPNSTVTRALHNRAPETFECNASGQIPGKILFKDSTLPSVIPARTRFYSEAPFYLYYESSATNDENNIMGRTPFTAGTPVAVPSLTPVSSYIFTDTLAITGHAAASTSVRVYVNGMLQGTVTSGTDGSFNFTANLVEGNNTIFATAWDGSIESVMSNTLEFEYVPAVATGVDYVVSVLSAGSTSVDVGGQLPVSFEVSNLGTNVAIASYTSFYLSKDNVISSDDYSLDNVYTDALTLGALTVNTDLTIPANVKPGVYNLIAFADGTTSRGEDNEANNSIVGPQVTVIHVTDMIVSDLSTTASTVELGLPFPVHMEVSNLGTSITGQTTTVLYLSTDTTFSADDRRVAHQYMGGITAGGVDIRDFDVSYKGYNAKPGTFYLLAVADDYQHESEIDETNNVFVGPLLNVIQNADSTVSNVTIDKSVVEFGETVNLNFELTNLGTSLMTNSYTGIYISPDPEITTDDISLLNRWTGEIGPGEVYNINVALPVKTQSNLSPGTYYIGVIVDHYGAIAELDETNNVAATPGFTLVQNADVVVGNVSIDQVIVEQGQSVNLHYEITNQGSYIGATYTAIYLSPDPVITTDDIHLDNFWTTPIDGGSVLVKDMVLPIKHYSNLTPGTYYVGVIADYDDRVVEIDDTNNGGASNDFSLVQYADLTVTSVTTPVTTVEVGKRIDVHVELTNLGTSDIGYNYTGFYLSTDAVITQDDQRISSKSISTIDAGTTKGIDFVIPANGWGWSVAPGTYYLGVIADDDLLVLETDETNNAGAGPLITVVQYADLVVSSVSTATTTYLPSDNITINTVLANQGTSYIGNSDTAFYLSTDAVITPDDQMIYSKYVGGINGGETAIQDVTFPLNGWGAVAPGTYYIGAITDIRDENGETDETNNSLAGTVIVVQ